MRPPRPLTPTARTPAQDATRDSSAAILGSREQDPFTSRDPVDDLVDRVRPAAHMAVDPLQVAAVLETGGMTDRTAQVEYGYADVFTLAEEVYRRGRPDPSAAPAAPATPAPRARGRRSARVAALRDILHGPLYLLPAAMFPAVLAVLGRRPLATGLLSAGVIGWIWAGTARWLAYRLLGRGHPGGAGRVLRRAALAGLPVAAAAGFALEAAVHAGYGLIALSVGQMAYQMASNILVYYRREVLLFVAVLPAVLLGAGYVALGRTMLPWAIGAAVACTVLAFALAMVQTTGRAVVGERRMRDGLRGDLRTLPTFTFYLALSAAFLLYPQARYVLTRFDIALALIPLILGMGMVEWRARRFAEQARALLRRVRYPAQFRPRIWLSLAGGFLTCSVAVAVFGSGLLAALRPAHLFSVPAAVLVSADAVLAGAYFLGSVLATMDRYGWLCWSSGLCTAGCVAAGYIGPWKSGPLADTVVFLGSTLLLALLFLIALAGRIAEARYHR